MNFYDLYTDALEKVALTFDELPQYVRSHIAEQHAARQAMTYGGLASHHMIEGRRATKQNKTSVKKSEKPGVLSTIRHSGREKAKTYHKGRAKSTAADMKRHGRELGKADKKANEYFDVLKNLYASEKGSERRNQIISDYNKKHMKATVRMSPNMI